MNRNYESMIAYAMGGSAPAVLNTSGNPVAVSGTGLNVANVIGTLLTSYSGAGVVLGTGDKATDKGDYRLSGDLVTGFTYSSTKSVTRTSDKVTVQAKYTITNNNSAAITIREVGVMTSYGSSNAYCMVDRQLLDLPLTIEAGGVGQLEFTEEIELSREATENTLDVAGVYGVEWCYGDTLTRLARFGAASGFADPVPATAVDGQGSSSFDSIAPWSGMKRYNILDDGTMIAEGASGFSYGNDTVVYIPEFYVAAQKDATGMLWRWAISPTAREGFVKHPGSGRYVGRYHTSVVSSVYCSKTGNSPKVSITRATARTNSHAKGDKWWLLDYASWNAIQWLYLVEYANFYSQSTLGNGQNSGSVKAAGGTDTCVYHSLKRSGNSNQYRWIEDPWSNVFDWVDGFVASERAVYIGTEPSTYGDTVEGLTATGVNLPSEGYISGFGYSNVFPWAMIPDKAGGAATNCVTDYVYSNTGVRVLYAGGSYSSSDSYGLFYTSAGNYATYLNGSLGSRLLYIP